MPDLNRLKKFDSAKTKSAEKKQPSVDFGQLVKELQAIAISQQTSQKAITKSIDQLSKVVLLASEEGFDSADIVNAINGLKDRMAEKHRIPADYRIDFERDKHGLFKTGIKLSAVPKKLN